MILWNDFISLGEFVLQSCGGCRWKKRRLLFIQLQLLPDFQLRRVFAPRSILFLILALGGVVAPGHLARATDAELEQALRKRDQAFAASYRATKKGNPAEANRIIQGAVSEMSQLLANRHSAEMSHIFDRAYFPDGTNMKLEEYHKDPERFDREHQRQEARPSEPSLSQLPTPAAQMPPMLGGGARGGELPGPSQPDLILDGSKVEKEIVYPGPRPAKQSTPVPSETLPSPAENSSR